MFLIKRDFYRYLNSNDISVLLSEAELYSDEILNESIDFAIEFVKSKLQHRYDPDKIFINVNLFDNSVQYSPADTETEAIADLVLYSETEWDATSDYVLGDRVEYENRIYKANTTPTTGTFTASQWDLITNNESYYYCIVESTGNYPDNEAYFIKADIRNKLIRDYCITIALKRIFIRVQPRVIPEWVIVESDRAEEHLNRISNGKDTVLLPVKTDIDGNLEGATFLYGSETQKDFNY